MKNVRESDFRYICLFLFNYNKSEIVFGKIGKKYQACTLL